jgi:hypothetical protein
MSQEKEKLEKLIAFFELPSITKQIDHEAWKRHQTRSTFLRTAVRRALEEVKP